MSKIEILSFKRINAGCLVGSFNMYVPKMGLEINNCNVFQKNTGERWITFPSREYETEGQKKYFPYLRFREKEHMEIFTKVVFESLDKYFSENPIVADEDLPF